MTADFRRFAVDIPMRDGVRLHTVIALPVAAADAPILFSRTPYGADARLNRAPGECFTSIVPQGDEIFAAAGYIRVVQDVRGKYGSEGDYVLTRPARGRLNPTETDHTTDAWDTIAWLTANLAETSGQVAMIGCSYEGFCAVMALLDPHPALKAAAIECPLIDGWRGDDWFTGGAFRQPTFDYLHRQTKQRGEGRTVPRAAADDYAAFLRAGSAGAWAEAAGLGDLPAWQAIRDHPAYDDFWRAQTLDTALAARPSTVPTLWTGALFDQEDMWGVLRAWAAVGERPGQHLVMGPWRHCQCYYDGFTHGPLRWEGDTADQFRRDRLKPFLDFHLGVTATDPRLPRVTVYNTGEPRWQAFAAWPPATGDRALYLTDGGVAWTPAEGDGADSFVSDPAKPVPHAAVPVTLTDIERARTWLVADQRFAACRPDVLVYASAELTEPVALSGVPVVDLWASTSGSDADWVVKLIDVWPDETPSRPEMSGYQLPVAMSVCRGRYRDDPARPTPVPPNKPQNYRFDLPAANHVFLPGHRIMVHVQSTWFPMYDRNPQSFVPNIFAARPQDYVAARHTVHRSRGHASRILWPTVPTPALAEAAP